MNNSNDLAAAAIVSFGRPAQMGPHAEVAAAKTISAH